MRRYACSASTGAVSVLPINCENTKACNGLLEPHRAKSRWFFGCMADARPLWSAPRGGAGTGRKCNDTLGTRMRRCERAARCRLQLLDAELEFHPEQPNKRRECFPDD